MRLEKKEQKREEYNTKQAREASKSMAEKRKGNRLC